MAGSEKNSVEFRSDHGSNGFQTCASEMITQAGGRPQTDPLRAWGMVLGGSCDGLGRVLGVSWEGLGKVLGGSWKCLGRVLGASWVMILG